MAEKRMVLKVLLQVRNPTWRLSLCEFLERPARFKATCAPGRGRFLTITVWQVVLGKGWGSSLQEELPFQSHLVPLPMNLAKLPSPEGREGQPDAVTTEKASLVRKVILSFLLHFLGVPKPTAH